MRERGRERERDHDKHICYLSTFRLFSMWGCHIDALGKQKENNVIPITEAENCQTFSSMEPTFEYLSTKYMMYKINARLFLFLLTLD